MRELLMLFFILLSFKVNSQNNNSFSILKYDCEITSDKKFRNSKEIIFVFPNDKDSFIYVEWTKSWIKGLKRFGSECKIMYERDLNSQDFSKTMLILGNLNSFKNWNRFEIPINQIPNGFEFANMNFTCSNDAIFYLSDTTAKAMRLIITGNNMNSLLPIVNNMRTGYSYLIFQDGMINHFGNCTDNKFDKSKYVYLPDLKSKYYKLVKTKYYDFYISNRLKSQVPEQKHKLDSLDLLIDKFVNKMQLRKSSYRIPCFIHYDQEEISYISTYFNDFCQGKTYGRVNGTEIHSKGFDGAIEHETEHLVFDSEYNKRGSTFFGEGILQYYYYVLNSKELSDGLKTANEFLGEDIKPVILGYEDFFQSNKYYKISGILVKYLVDNWGLEKFKQFYSTNNIEIGIEKIYGITLDQVLINFKEWLKTNS